MVGLLTLLVVILQIFVFFGLFCKYVILRSPFEVIKRGKTIKYCLRMFQGVRKVSPHGTYVRLGGISIFCSLFYLILVFFIRDYQANLWPDLPNIELLTLGLFFLFKASKIEPRKYEWHHTVIDAHRIKYNKIPRRRKYVSDERLFKVRFYKPKVQIVRESRTKRIREPR